MSINVDFDYLLQKLPELLSWLVPGLLFSFSYQYLKYEETNNSNDSISIIKAISISFFIRYSVIIVLSWFPGDWLWGLDGNVWIAICSCLVAIVLGGSLGYASNHTAVKDFSEKYLHLTLNGNPFFDLPDKKSGCYVRVFLNQNKDEYIFGIYSNCYNRENEDWVVVKNPIRITGTYDLIKERDYRCTEQRINSKLLINTRDIILLEYIYTDTP